MPNTKSLLSFAALLLVAGSSAVAASAQSGATRPRRVNPASNAPATRPAAATTTTTTDTPATATTSAPRPARTTNAATTTTTTGAAAVTPAAGPGDTTRAYALLQQKQYDAALTEARKIAAAEPNNSEAWKIAGFAQFNLKRYPEAATDLQRALDLQRTAKAEDANTIDALAQAYVRTEKFEQALPLLQTATTRAGAKPDGVLLYYRGLSEFRTNKTADAERSFNEAVKADPKNSAALFYLGRIAYERKDDDAAVNALNRATLSDPKLGEAWLYLTYAYLRRAGAAAGPKANAENLNAVRASEGLLKVRTDEAATYLHAQALVATDQFPRAALALERVAASPDVKGQTLYLLGYAHAQARNFPKAVAALERAAAKSPQDANVYRMLGYAHESSKQYAKALAAYEKGLQLAPDDAYFKESAERVRPFAK